MNELSEIIRAEIAKTGSIPFERFMELALYHPAHGYYRRGRETPRTGRKGDFFTSVSVGPLFGRLLARQFLEMWERMEKPAPFWIVEQGAEDGRLAGDILVWCRDEAPDFFAALQYGIFEIDSSMRDEQEKVLAAVGFEKKVKWIAEVESWESNEKPMGVFFSNELVDAFPVHRVVRRGDAWREHHVVLDEQGRFTWCEREIQNATLAGAVQELPALDGYATEINLRARRWMEWLAETWVFGYVVTIDYGFPASIYYEAFRKDGTLSGYKEHRRVDDILAEPGSCDITAHVDFTALARIGEKEGLVTLGFLDQQHFLTGIAHDELEGRAGPRAGVAENLRAWQTLTHPEYLGTRFQVLLQAKNAPGSLAGLRYARPGGLD
jgi:SAM-dependent MidA family methyltransferase